MAYEQFKLQQNFENIAKFYFDESQFKAEPKLFSPIQSQLCKNVHKNILTIPFDFDSREAHQIKLRKESDEYYKKNSYLEINNYPKRIVLHFKRSKKNQENHSCQ